MSSSSPPATPSHRTPLTLLSKLKRQLSKSPVAQHQKQPIEHQYLPIPTVSFSESLHSNQALSTYSCSNNSSSTSSFVLIDDEQPDASFGVDEYRPFLPLIIQHERLQQQQRLAHPRPAPTSAHRARILPLPNEPPSPTSTASSKSPVTPIFPSSYFTEGDDDDIMTMSNSEVGSISEYSLPRSLSAYMNEARNVRSWRGRKSGYRTSSDSESRHRRSRGMTITTPPPGIISRKSFPPISPPPSCPLPEPPVSVVEPTSTAIRPKTPTVTKTPLVITSDSESSSSNTRSSRNELTAPPTLVPASSLSPAICLDPKTKPKPKPSRPESTATILSDLEIFVDSPTTCAFATTTPSSEEPSDHQKDDDDDASPSASTRTSVSTPTTPRQYGIGRQVLSGSGSGRDFDFIGSNSKRLSASAKRDSAGLEKKGSRLSFGLESAAENNGNVEQSDKPCAAAAAAEVNHQDHPTPSQVRTQIPTPTLRRRVKSDDTNPSSGAKVSRRATYHDKHRERTHPEWTLFLGIPRNAVPPPPSPPAASVLFSTGELNVKPNLASTAPAPAITHRHSLLSTHFLTPTMTMMRNRTKSDSALLATASSLAPAAPNGAEEHDNGKSNVTKTKRGEEDWTLSLPLVVSPAAPASASSAEVLRGSKQHSDAPSVSQPVVEKEECQPREGEVVDTTQDLVITVEDVDKGEENHLQNEVLVSSSEEEEEEKEKEQDQDPMILRVPRIVRSCSSYPILSTTSTSPTHNIHGRLKKSSSTKWMAKGATSTPNLRGAVSSCTLEEEVISMLLGDSATEEDDDDGDSGESQSSKSKSPSSSSTTTTKKDLEKKKMATLDEDLARFNALLKNGNQSGTMSRPVSSIIENAVAAAAAAAAAAAIPLPTATATATPTKTKTVTLNSHPDPIPTTPSNTASTSNLPPSLGMKKKSTSPTILKPALKHVKSCDPFLLEKSSSSSDSAPPSMGPVMRFPSSSGRGNLNFFDELGRGGGHGGHGETFKPNRASLRLTKSAEWNMGDDDHALALHAPPPLPPVPTATTKSRPTSASSRVPQQQRATTMSRPASSSSRASQQQRTTTISRPASASSRISQQQRTATMSRPTSASSRVSPQQQFTTTTMSRPTSSPSSSRASQQQRPTSRSNSPMSTSTTQTPMLLPFAHYNTKFASSSSSSSSSSSTTTSNMKSKGSLGGRYEMNASRGGGVPTMPFRALSMGSMTAPVESTSGPSASQAEKQKQQHHRKRCPPVHLPLHTPNSSSSSSASTLTSSAPAPQHRHIVISIDNIISIDDSNDSIFPPPPPSPIASDSSSTLPTPLASAFPLPPSSPGISICELDDVEAIQQRLREFEDERQQQQQQQQRAKHQYLSYKPPSSASSFSSTATVVPFGDQKMRMRSMSIGGGSGGGVGQEGEEEDVQEEDEDSTCASIYYTARSSFSHDRSPGF